MWLGPSLRKTWLHHHFQFAQLSGIGGPGAPHSMRLERIGSTGEISLTIVLCHERSWDNSSNTDYWSRCPSFGRNSKRDSGLQILGQVWLHTKPFGCHLEDIRIHIIPNDWIICLHIFAEVPYSSKSKSNITVTKSRWLVIHLDPSPLHRTKQWMSDGSWQPHMFLFLPASVARAVQGDYPPGIRNSECVCE